MQCFSTPPPSSTLIHIRSSTVSEWRDALVQCFSTPPPPSSTLIHIRSSTVSERRDALVQCFSTPPPSTLIHIRSSTVSEWRDALVQCFSTPPPPSTLIHIRSTTVSEWRDALVQCFSPPPSLYTDSYQIFHCVWMKGCSSAVLLNPPPPTLIHIRSTTVSEWRDALVQCFSTPPPPLLYTDSIRSTLCLNEGML